MAQKLRPRDQCREPAIRLATVSGTGLATFNWASRAVEAGAFNTTLQDPLFRSIKLRHHRGPVFIRAVQPLGGGREYEPRPDAVLLVLWRQLSDRVPDRLGQSDDLFEVAHEIANRLTRIFLRDQLGPAAGVWRHRKVSERSLLARQFVVLRVFSWRQRGWHRRQSSDRMDRARGAVDRNLRTPRRQGFPGRRAGCRL